MTDKSIERSGNNNKDHKQELSNVPELRFPGFKGEWISFKLSEVADVRDGTHDSPKYIEKGFPLITSKNLLQNGNINFDNVNYISEKDYMKINKRSEVSNGDILFGMIGTIGNPVLVKSNKKFAIKNVALIKEEKNLKNSYLIHYLNSNKISKQFYKYHAGGTQKFIALGLIRNLIINTPNINEQKKIADFLSAIDKKIKLMEKKYHHYNHFKKYLLQNFFNDNYSCNGFKKLFGESELIKLGELANIQTGNKDLKDKKEDGKYPFFVRSEKIERIDSYSFDGEAILIPGDGKIGEIYHYINGKFDYHQRVYKISNFENVMGKYLYYYLEENFLREAKRNTAKATVDSLRLSTITNMKIKLPDITVQNKIVDILSLTDKKIYSLQKGITLNKEFKRSLLSKMFC